MGITLYDHNAHAYHAALTMLRETGKAAVIHPTGTGKSFIGFKFCEEFPEKRFLWLSPSEYIFRTQLENLASDSGTVPENITFITYARLMTMRDNEIAAIQPDFIILDEFHRCGAEQWGQGVRKILNTYSDVPLLGLSATNIRYLDNQRDMAKELFDGNIASEITLGEAIARGILQPPKYVLSIYSYQKSLERYAERVRRVRNKAIRNKAEQLLEALRRSLENADGLDVVFQRHMPDRHGKYIVFCASAEHMDEMIAHVPEWFSAIDHEPNIYRAYSLDPVTRQAFDAFREDRSEHLKLLFTIDMLNEGIHVADIDGVILFRPTISPIIYKQQIGRTLSAGSEKTPVIFDVVNNIENLYSIGVIEQEFEEAVLFYGPRGEVDHSIRERFQIIDEVRDCKRLFERLNDTLTASWDTMYGYAKDYYEEHGNLEVPCAYKTAGGHSLGNWIMTQRAVRQDPSRGALSEERIAKLDTIGMRWTARERDRWVEYYAAAEEYARTHGNLNVPTAYATQDGINLGGWLSTLKVQKKRGVSGLYLTEERVAALDKLGMAWDVDKYQWEQKFQTAQSYFRDHGNLEVPTRYETPDGVRLGYWLQSARQDYKSGRLNEDQIRRLEAIGMVWDVEQARWERQYQAALAYYQKHGDLDIPSRYETPDGLKLGRWLQRMRRDHKKGALEQESIERLEAIGVTWDVRDDQWESYYQAAQLYYQEHGDLRIAPKYVAPDGTRLGTWIQRVRKWYRQNKLDAEQITRLESIGMIWDAVAEQRERNYRAALDYYREHGDLRVPVDYVAAGGLHLGWWVKGVRRAYQNGTLGREQADRLERIGMVWNTTGQSGKTAHNRQEYAQKD